MEKYSKGAKRMFLPKKTTSYKNETFLQWMVDALARRQLLNWMPDSLYISLRYWIKLKRKLNLNNPETFQEKLQWLKIHEHRDDVNRLADKLAVKDYILGKLGEQYVIPTVGGPWDSFEKIDFSLLPDQFVLKCTHDSGGSVICRGKKNFDVAAAKVKIDKAMKYDYFWQGREFCYKNIKRQIFAEQYCESETGSALIDYKFYCFEGEPRFLYVSEGLEDHSTAKISFLTLDWEFCDFWRSDYAPFDQLPPKPERLNEMISIARILSNGFKFIRVDLYEINHQVYFSELTFYPCGGMMPIYPVEKDTELGSYITL